MGAYTRTARSARAAQRANFPAEALGDEARLSRQHFHTTYDADGRRVKMTEGTKVTRFVYNAAGALVAEYTGATAPASPTKEYVYGPSGLLATVDSTGTRYLTPDHLGSTRIVTDPAQAVASRHDYFPFGEEIGAMSRAAGGYGQTGPRQKFTSYERDTETGLDFAQARYYASAQGRFTSVDPYLPSARAVEPQSWNRFSYVLNNPLRYVDPSGMNYSDLSAEQRRVFQSYADRYNQGNKTQLKAEAVYGTLSTSQMSTFESVTHALENTELRDKSGHSLGSALSLVRGVTEIAGEKVGSGEGRDQFRIAVQLNDDAVSKLKQADGLNPSGNGGHILENGVHKKGFPDFRQTGDVPRFQISYDAGRRRADIDIDYRRTFNEGHLEPYNSDVRAIGPERSKGRPINNYERHVQRYGKGLRKWWE